MERETFVSEAELAAQKPFIEQVRGYYSALLSGKQPLAFVRTFGCQQNVADSEKVMGMLKEMGFGFTDTPDEADFILFNTCAVREHAEDRVFGNVGALKRLKEDKPSLVIAVCGCMVQQEHIADKFYKSYPFVSLLFGTHRLHAFPELFAKVLFGKKRVKDITAEDGRIAEGLPVYRGEDKSGAWLPIMYGCNNFCTYCIVPYVRGRERSRRPEDIVAEAKELIAAGYKEITLLGQNVNSYGKAEGYDVDFPALLKMINDLPGEFLIRFMTSHPKDATKRLFDTIAECKKVSRHFHLPFQSGSNRILKEMNRRYTREQYLDLIAYAKSVVPDIAFTSDVIVGFPNETEEDFQATLDLVKEVGFVSLFTFIYSKREGTPAATMFDPVTHEEKGKRMARLTALQEEIAAEHSAALVGQTFKAILENDAGGFIEARLPDNRVVRVQADTALLGKRADVTVTEAKSWVLYGEVTAVYD